MKTHFTKFFLVVILLFASVSAFSTITLTKQVGWFESAGVEWTPVANAASYNVYYSGMGVTNKKIDTQLVRSYGSYFRADVIGIEPGDYTVTVKAVNSAGTEFDQITSSPITVMAFDRTGFAFYGGRVPGAYKANGTPKDNALVLYVSAVNEDTLKCNVVTSSKGATTQFVGIQAILDGFKKGYDTRPLIVRILGRINKPNTGDGGGDLLVQNDQNTSSYITVEGVGKDATINNAGVRIKTATNIEVRNLAAMNVNSTAGDDFGMQQDNDYCWFHNNDMFYGDAGHDADQVKGDGALDIKGANYCTFSYNHFWDNGKANLLGLSEGSSTGRYMTYHHNWYDHSDSRHPRVRFYNVHFYNNYLDGNAKYGSGSTENSSLFIENNYYRDCNHPMMISMQGTDIWDGSTNKNNTTFGTFSGEDGGMIKAYNNKFDADNGANDMRFVPYGATDAAYNIPGVISSTTDFDAYVVANRTDQVPSSVVSKQGAHPYSNFDTNLSCYISSLIPDSPDDAKTKVMAYAGRMEGGDFRWNFDNSVDDHSYLVIDQLKAAITNYQSSLVYVQGINSPAIITDQTLVLTSGQNTQTVNYGSPIAAVTYTWGGTATGTSVSGLDGTGLSSSVNTSNNTITISGTPTTTVNYTVTTTGTSGNSAVLTGTISVIAQTLTLTSASGTDNQTVQTGNSIASIVYSYGGTATSATVAGLDGTGLISTLDGTAKTITISGTPTSVVNYTVTTSGTGDVATATGTVTVSDGTLALTSVSGSDNQIVVSGNAITPIVYTWGGTATGTSVDGLDGTGLSQVSNATAKTVTISGTPTTMVNYTVTTEGSSTPVSMTGQVNVANQTLTLTSGSPVQTVASGAAITPIVYTWGGLATGAIASNLPAGLTATANSTTNTLTISGTPSESGTYTVTSTGLQGTAVSMNGAVTVTVGNMVQNFTTDGITSNFYTISGSLSKTYGTVSYNGLTLTQCLKMESSTDIAFTTVKSGTLTMVFNGAYTGTITIDGTVYNVTSTGILSVTLVAGSHDIKKKSGSTYLFYMSMVYDSTSGITNSESSASVSIYPNPVVDKLNISTDSQVNSVSVYSLSGSLIQKVEGNVRSVSLGNLSAGSYVVKVDTEKGSYKQKVVKK